MIQNNLIPASELPQPFIPTVTAKFSPNYTINAFMKIYVTGTDPIPQPPTHHDRILMHISTFPNQQQLIHPNQRTRYTLPSPFLVKTNPRFLPIIGGYNYFIQTTHNGIVENVYLPELQSLLNDLFLIRQILVQLRGIYPHEIFSELCRKDRTHPSRILAQQFILWSVKVTRWNVVLFLTGSPNQSNLSTFAHNGKDIRFAEYQRVWTLIESLEGTITPRVVELIQPMGITFPRNRKLRVPIANTVPHPHPTAVPVANTLPLPPTGPLPNTVPIEKTAITITNNGTMVNKAPITNQNFFFQIYIMSPHQLKTEIPNRVRATPVPRATVVLRPTVPIANTVQHQTAVPDPTVVQRPTPVVPAIPAVKRPTVRIVNTVQHQTAVPDPTVVQRPTPGVPAIPAVKRPTVRIVNTVQHQTAVPRPATVQIAITVPLPTAVPRPPKIQIAYRAPIANTVPRPTTVPIVNTVPIPPTGPLPNAVPIEKTAITITNNGRLVNTAPITNQNCFIQIF